MNQRNIRILIGIGLMTAFTIWVSSVNLEYIPSETEQPQPLWAQLLFWQGEQERSIRVHQGLDLQGGLQVVLEADLPPEQELQEGSMEAARIVVDNRVNALGVTEPLVQLQGDRRIIVELPGIDNPELAINTIRETGLLEFVDADFTPLPEGAVIRTSLGDPEFFEPPAEEAAPGEEDAAPEEEASEEVITQQEVTNVEVFNPERVFETIITGSDLADVSNAGLDPNSRQVVVNFNLKSDGAQVFGAYSGSSIGEYLCIVLDKTVLSCPVINDRISNAGQITLGNNDLQEGQSLAIQLRYGALPVPLKVVENRTVGPTLGQDSVTRSIRAGSLGLIIVLLFMLVYYRLPGFVAGLALIIYGLMNFALYKLIPVTITLPAATGFILSVGMAVDANILVFERMKEELRDGKTLRRSMELGFTRAWPSIRDSAVSTLITCAILFWFGSNFGASIVKGFAITLALGVITNVFTAVTVTRSLLRFAFALTGPEIHHNKTLMGFSLETADKQAPTWANWLLQIVDYRKVYYVFSGVVITAGLIAMGMSIAQFGSPLKLSVDFTSGSLMELLFEEPVEPNEVRQIFAEYTYDETEFNDTSVTTAEQLGQETILIRSKFLEEDAKYELQEVIRSEVGEFEELRFDSVGPAIGQEVAQAGSYAVIAAALAILLFLVFAFRSVAHAFRYGVAAVVAMAHDILITSGFFAIMGMLIGWEVDALFLTAILTVIGYSVHDTIIVFDRLRENIPQRRGESFEVVANRSVLETINRSIVTSLSTLFVVVAILVFGGSTIQQFIAILMVGIISGTYSSIFVAVPLLVSWREGEFGNPFNSSTETAPASA